MLVLLSSWLVASYLLPPEPEWHLTADAWRLGLATAFVALLGWGLYRCGTSEVCAGVVPLILMMPGATAGAVLITVILVVTVLLPAAYVAHMWAPNWWNTLSLAFLFMTYFLNIFHMRHHRGGRTYKNETLHRLTNPFYDVLDNTFGIHIEAWLLSHNARHHVHTNHDEHDPDVKITADLLRMLPSRQRKWFHKYQSGYCVALFSLAVCIYPWANAFLKTPRGDRKWLALWCTLCVAVPAALNGATGLAWVACMYTLASVVVAYLFTVSHNNDGIVKSHGTNETPQHIDEWLEHQIHSAVSWGGYASTLVCGGLNLQVEHHLAPAHVPTLYHFLRPPLERICRAHGLGYVFYPTLFGAMCGMHVKLHKLGVSMDVSKPGERPLRLRGSGGAM